MSLDVKYRPQKYEDVLGQEAIIQILTNVIKKGEEFQQSYVFAGPHGSGKTTLGRIFGKALLCENKKEGEPCYQCESCKEIAGGRSLDFVEFDAASNSGKADIQKLLSDSKFSSLKGKRKIFLIDESHRLSKEALDALLKPMEDTDVSGSRKIICIFATTEPEKMVNTILSRCAPMFMVTKPDPSVLGVYLKKICDEEKIPYDSVETLENLSLLVKCHVRDALKALALIEPLDSETLKKHFRITNYQKLVEILEKNFQEEPIFSDLEVLVRDNPPEILYRQISEIFYNAFKLKSGSKADPYLEKMDLEFLKSESKGFLLKTCAFFSEKPLSVSLYTLLNDISVLKREDESEKAAPISRFETLKKVGNKLISSDGFVGDVRAIKGGIKEKSKVDQLSEEKFAELLDLSYKRVENKNKNGP